MPLFGPKAPKAPEPTPEPPAAPPPAEPKFGKEEVEALVTGMAGQFTGALTQLGERVEALASRQPQVIVQSQPTNMPQDNSDEELDNAVMSGQGAASRIKALVERRVNQAVNQVIKDHIEPLQNFGVNALGNQAVEIAKGKMPFYTKFHKEIDQRVAALTGAAKADPAVLKLVHDAVVGEHAAELQREAAEEAIRKASEVPAAPVAPTRTRSGSATAGTGAAPGAPRDGGDIPSPTDLGGADASAALSHKGRGGQDQDAFAQSMGYDSWSAYIKQYDELVKAESQGNA